MLDPDPDPDPDEMNADPQPCLQVAGQVVEQLLLQLLHPRVVLLLLHLAVRLFCQYCKGRDGGKSAQKPSLVNNIHFDNFPKELSEIEKIPVAPKLENKTKFLSDFIGH
jgi:hypothetical protein